MDDLFANSSWLVPRSTWRPREDQNVEKLAEKKEAIALSEMDFAADKGGVATLAEEV
jgi:hypothetical protein